MFKNSISILTIMMMTGCALLAPGTDTPGVPASPDPVQQSESPAPPVAPAKSRKKAVPVTPSITADVTPSSLPDSLDEELKRIFLTQHREWRGTRYRMGGLSRQGIDCSGLVFLTFQSRLGITLPRNSSRQSQQGKEVARKDLQTGDLVFFRTGRSNHVGIYVENGKFLHTSTRAGVKLSRLDDQYWSRTYWKARRLDLPTHRPLAKLK